MEQEISELLLFEVDGHRYGIPTSDVVQLLRAATIMPLPKAPDIVEGILNVRGKIVPVLNIRKRFRLAPKPLEISDHLIIAQADQRTIALRADRVVYVLHIDEHAIEDATRIAPGVEYVAGVAKLPDGLVIIHDLHTFLSQAESDALSRSLETQD